MQHTHPRRRPCGRSPGSQQTVDLLPAHPLQKAGSGTSRMTRPVVASWGKEEISGHSVLTHDSRPSHGSPCIMHSCRSCVLIPLGTTPMQSSPPPHAAGLAMHRLGADEALCTSPHMQACCQERSVDRSSEEERDACMGLRNNVNAWRPVRAPCAPLGPSHDDDA
jgi:hypothetical protein